MRIIRLLLSLLLTGALLGGIGFFVGREILLATAVAQVQDIANEMVKATSRQQYWQECVSFAAANSNLSEVKSVELAFTSDTEYQLQVICPQFTFEPVVVDFYTLPQYVTKKPGSGGLVAGEKTISLVTLGIWGRERSIFIQNQKVASGFGPLQETSSVSPATSCSGYGYSCCQSASQSGEGDSNTQVIDCPKSCFSQCLARPVVLSFNTQPFFDSNRKVTLKAGETLTLSYVINPGSSAIKEIVLDFGDGQETTSTMLTNTVTHVYRCAQALCQYQVSLTATDVVGVSNAASSVNGVQLMITQP